MMCSIVDQERDELIDDLTSENLRLYQENIRLRERLEIHGHYETVGDQVLWVNTPDVKLDDAFDSDGIACRDATIELIEERLKECENIIEQQRDSLEWLEFRLQRISEECQES